jgi:multidrug efflux pump
MSFTDLFIRRPVLALVVSALLLLLGLQAAGKLEIRQYPQLERSQIFVVTSYPGASASTVEGFVTAPLQQRIAGARGIEYMSAESVAGRSEITVHARLGEDASAVLTEVIAKVNEARFELPREIEDPVITTRTGGDAIMYLAFLSDEMTPSQINDYLRREVQPELATLEGVGQATVMGGQELAMRVWLDPARMAAHAVTAEDVTQALSRENHVSAAGTTDSGLVRATVDAETDRRTPREFEDIVIRQEQERRVRLGDVASIELSSSSFEFAAFSSGRETIYVSINEAPGANLLQVTARVHEVLPRLEARLPADLEIFIDYDASIYIQKALDQVLLTLLEAALIVMVVIYLFLGSLRVIGITLVTIPLSLVGVLFVMWAVGFSINLLTLLAMVISIGLVVDDAIVVVENVHRFIEEGETPLQAALKGARQVALPVVAMTLTLAAVFAPIAFIGGLTGTLFREFALTLAGAVLVSGVIALTLSPVMCAYLMRDHAHQEGFANWLDRAFRRIRDAYQRALARTLGAPGAVLLFATGILLSLPLLLLLTRQELAPEEDSGNVYVVASPPQYANLEYINRYLDDVVAIWKKVPEVDYSWQISSPSFVFGGLTLTPWDQRARSQAEVQAELQGAFAGVAGLEVFTFAEPPLPGADAGLPVNFVIASTADYESVQRVGDEVLARARDSGLFGFVRQTLQFDRPETAVTIDRDKAARLGVSMRAIGDTLATMLGESEVGRFSLQGRSYKVIPQAARNFRLTREWLERYYVRTADGKLVPLATLITLEQRVEPNTRRQYQQLNSTTIQGLVVPPHTVGDALGFLERALEEAAPSGFRVGYEGESRRYVQESEGFAVLFGISLLVIFLVLAAQFNSFRDPLIVLVSVPMSVFGAVVPIALGYATLNIYTQVGLLTLIGLISKHGILIVQFANTLAEAGASRGAAVLEAATLRLRPILMTTAATALGVLPLLLASGPGANSRFAIGLMIFAGMLVGTLFTLFVVPVVYLRLASEHRHADAGAAVHGECATAQATR